MGRAQGGSNAAAQQTRQPGNFTLVFGPRRGGGAARIPEYRSETLTARSYNRDKTPGRDLVAVLDETGIHFRELDGTEAAFMDWPAFQAQLGMTMYGGFVISSDLLVDGPTLRSLMDRSRNFSQPNR